MIEIELGPRSEKQCSCCGGITTTLTRFVHRDGDAHAVYFASFAELHPEAVVTVLLGLGEWGEGSTRDQRLAFGLRIWLEGKQFQVGVVDAGDLGWPEPSLLGRRLSRAEALGHPWIKEVFHLSDHI